MSPRKREPTPPAPIPGVEIRRRDRRGFVYYEFRVRWKNPATGKRPVQVCSSAQLKLGPDATIAEREQAARDDAQDALDFKAHLRLLDRHGKLEDLDRGRVLLTEFAPRWLQEWAKVNLTIRTLDTYANIYDRHLDPRIGGLQLRRITAGVVDQLKTNLSDAGVGDPTIIKAMTVLQSMLRQAIVWGEMDPPNPVKEVKKPPARRSKVITPLTIEQVETILHWLEFHARPEDRMLAELLAYGAGRPQDVLALTFELIGQQRLVYAWKNVDGKILPGAKTGEDKARSVTMLKIVRADLLAYRTARMAAGNHRPDALVIARPDGLPWREHDYKNWATKRARGRRREDGSRSGSLGPFAEAAKAAGVPTITPYTLRHTYASLRIAEQKLSLQEIGDELGHDVETLSATYAHVISEYRGQGPINPDELIQEARAKIARGATTNEAEEAM